MKVWCWSSVFSMWSNAAVSPRKFASTLPKARLIAFSALAMPLNAVQLPLSVYLPSIFAQHFGLSLAMLGVIFLAAKIWGTLTDPIIGALSDRGRSRFGRRRSWILAGGVVFGVSGLLLFFPEAAVGAVYLTVVLFFFYLGWSMIQIPFFAWSGELSRNYDERTRVATYQTVAGSTALLLILILPTILDQFRPGDAALKLNAMGAFILSTLVIGLILTLSAFPEPLATTSANARSSLGRSVRLVLSNALLMRVLASDFAVTLGQYIRGTLFVFFVSAHSNGADPAGPAGNFFCCNSCSASWRVLYFVDEGRL